MERLSCGLARRNRASSRSHGLRTGRILTRFEAALNRPKPSSRPSFSGKALSPPSPQGHPIHRPWRARTQSLLGRAGHRATPSRALCIGPPEGRNQYFRSQAAAAAAAAAAALGAPWRRLREAARTGTGARSVAAAASCWLTEPHRETSLRDSLRDLRAARERAGRCCCCCARRLKAGLLLLLLAGSGWLSRVGGGLRW